VATPQTLPSLDKQPQHLQDSLTLVKDLETLQFPDNIILFTFDVESLYPNIPTKEGFHALREIIKEKFRTLKLNMIMTLAGLVLEHYHLDLKDKY
jgi:hypothetical protein